MIKEEEEEEFLLTFYNLQNKINYKCMYLMSWSLLGLIVRPINATCGVYQCAMAGKHCRGYEVLDLFVIQHLIRLNTNESKIIAL